MCLTARCHEFFCQRWWEKGAGSSLPLVQSPHSLKWVSILPLRSANSQISVHTPKIMSYTDICQLHIWWDEEGVWAERNCCAGIYFNRLLFFLTTELECDAWFCYHSNEWNCSHQLPAESFAKSAVATIGIQNDTCGCFSHALQVRGIPPLINSQDNSFFFFFFEDVFYDHDSWACVWYLCG